MTKADIILSSQAVFTGLGDQPSPASIAVKGNKIVAVGDSNEMQPFIGSDTKKLDFGDQLITAGFHDAHLHLLSGSLTNDFSVNLQSARSEEEAVMMVKEFAEKTLQMNGLLEMAGIATIGRIISFPTVLRLTT